MPPTEQGLETGGSQALGLLIRAWTCSMGSVILSNAAPKAACKGPGQKSCLGFESHFPEKLH